MAKETKNDNSITKEDEIRSSNKKKVSTEVKREATKEYARRARENKEKQQRLNALNGGKTTQIFEPIPSEGIPEVSKKKTKEKKPEIDKKTEEVVQNVEEKPLDSKTSHIDLNELRKVQEELKKEQGFEEPEIDYSYHKTIDEEAEPAGQTELSLSKPQEFNAPEIQPIVFEEQSEESNDENDTFSFDFSDLEEQEETRPEEDFSFNIPKEEEPENDFSFDLSQLVEEESSAEEPFSFDLSNIEDNKNAEQPAEEVPAIPETIQEETAKEESEAVEPFKPQHNINVTMADGSPIPSNLNLNISITIPEGVKSSETVIRHEGEPTDTRVETYINDNASSLNGIDANTIKALAEFGIDKSKINQENEEKNGQNLDLSGIERILTSIEENTAKANAISQEKAKQAEQVPEPKTEVDIQTQAETLSKKEEAQEPNTNEHISKVSNDEIEAMKRQIAFERGEITEEEYLAGQNSEPQQETPQELIDKNPEIIEPEAQSAELEKPVAEDIEPEKTTIPKQKTENKQDTSEHISKVSNYEIEATKKQIAFERGEITEQEYLDWIKSHADTEDDTADEAKEEPQLEEDLETPDAEMTVDEVNEETEVTGEELGDEEEENKALEEIKKASKRKDDSLIAPEESLPDDITSEEIEEHFRAQEKEELKKIEEEDLAEYKGMTEEEIAIAKQRKRKLQELKARYNTKEASQSGGEGDYRKNLDFSINTSIKRFRVKPPRKPIIIAVASVLAFLLVVGVAAYFIINRPAPPVVMSSVTLSQTYTYQYVGDELDIRGLYANCKYSDGSIRKVKITKEMISRKSLNIDEDNIIQDYDNLDFEIPEGTTKSTFVYFAVNGFEAKLDIRITKLDVESISAELIGQSFIVGQTIDFDNFLILANTTSGEKIRINAKDCQLTINGLVFQAGDSGYIVPGDYVGIYDLQIEYLHNNLLYSTTISINIKQV